MLKLEEFWRVGMAVLLRKTYRDELTEENSGITNIEATTQIADTQPQKKLRKAAEFKTKQNFTKFFKKEKIDGLKITYRKWIMKKN